MLECEQLDARILPSVAPIPLGHGLQGPALAYVDQPDQPPPGTAFTITDFTMGEDAAVPAGVTTHASGHVNNPAFNYAVVHFTSTTFTAWNGQEAQMNETTGNFDEEGVVCPHNTSGWVYAQAQDFAGNWSPTVNDYLVTT